MASAQTQPSAAPATQVGIAQPEAASETLHRLAATLQATSSPGEPRPGPVSVSSSAHAAQQAAALPGAAAVNAGVQTSAEAMPVPFHVPETTQPVMFKVEQEQEDGENGSGGAGANAAGPSTSRSTRARWAWSMSASGSAKARVSVKLSAGTLLGAADLSTWLPELKTSLEQADFVTGELSATLARPR